MKESRTACRVLALIQMEEISSLLFVENIHLFLQPLWPRSLLYLYQYSVIRARSSTILHFFQFLHPALIVYFPYHVFRIIRHFHFRSFFHATIFKRDDSLPEIINLKISFNLFRFFYLTFVSLILKESPTPETVRPNFNTCPLGKNRHWTKLIIQTRQIYKYLFSVQTFLSYCLVPLFSLFLPV